MTELRLLTLVGSLRKTSINQQLLSAWAERLPPTVSTLPFSLAEIPLYNADLDEPPAVAALKQAVSDCHGVVIATPEYNYGIPGVLKNALDWASRPAYKSAFVRKPVGIMGAAPGAVGTARAQGQLKEVLLGMLAELYPCPELAVGMSGTKFDATGHVLDAALDTQLTRHALEFAQWVKTHSA